MTNETIDKNLEGILKAIIEAKKEPKGEGEITLHLKEGTLRKIATIQKMNPIMETFPKPDEIINVLVEQYYNTLLSNTDGTDHKALVAEASIIRSVSSLSDTEPSISTDFKKRD